MTRTLWIATRVTLLTLVLTGILYPLLVTGLSQVFFPARASGSLVTDDRGRVVGSELIGQGFSQPAYLQPRPSAAGDKGYDALASGGSNLGTTSAKLQERVRVDLERLRRENAGSGSPVPAELLMASGSGLDPQLSPGAALWQAVRIAQARKVSVDRVRRLIDVNTEPRDFGLLGEPRVNVLLVNLALDRQLGQPPRVR